MIFFGHLGITSGIVKGAETVLNKTRPGKNIRLDYHFVLVGSLLPDLIDKPLGMGLFRHTFHNSRLFGHTLLFAAAVAAVGWLFRRWKKDGRWLLLGIGSLIHLPLDSMWLFPVILFWPFLSRTFPVRPAGNWVTEDLQHLLSDPVTMGAECAGFIILAFLIVRAVRRGQFSDFIRNGKL